MAEIDTSMYPRPAAPTNPLETLSTLQSLRSRAIQNDLTMRSMNAQQAVGNAIQGATGADGSFDPNAFSAAVAHDPQAAFAAQEAQQFAQAQRVSQLGMAIDKQSKLNSVLGSTLSAATNDDGSFNPDKLTPEFISGQVGELVKEGVLDEKTAASELGSMPTDPGQRYQWLKAHLAQGLSSQQQYQSAYGQLMQTDLGGTIQTTRVPELGTGTGFPATMNKTMTPGDANSPVQGVKPDGSSYAIPKQQFAEQGGIQTGLAPAAVAAQTTSGAGNANQALEFQKANQDNANVKAILGNMQGDLKNFTSGKGAQEWKDLLSSAGRLGVPVNQNMVASQENFTKLAIQLAQRTGAMFNANGSDARFLASAESNPNVGMTNESNKRVINILKGNIDAQNVVNGLWQKFQALKGPQSFGSFMNQVNQKIDPRVFQMQYMGPAERQTMLNGMTPQERQQFDQKYQQAVRAGWVGGH